MNWITHTYNHIYIYYSVLYTMILIYHDLILGYWDIKYICIYIHISYIYRSYVYIYIIFLGFRFIFRYPKATNFSRRVSPQEFIDAVKWLEMRGVAGITGDCGFMMAFQPLASTLSIVLQELMVFF